MNNRKEWLPVNRDVKLRDILGREELKFPIDKGSLIILYEGQTLMNTYYCLILSTFTMKIYCYKAGLQTAEQYWVYVETKSRSLKLLHVKNFHQWIKHYVPIESVIVMELKTGDPGACLRTVFEETPSKTSENALLENRMFSFSSLNFKLRRRTRSEKVVSFAKTEFMTQMT